MQFRLDLARFGSFWFVLVGFGVVLSSFEGVVFAADDVVGQAVGLGKTKEIVAIENEVEAKLSKENKIKIAKLVNKITRSSNSIMKIEQAMQQIVANGRGGNGDAVGRFEIILVKMRADLAKDEAELIKLKGLEKKKVLNEKVGAGLAAADQKIVLGRGIVIQGDVRIIGNGEELVFPGQRLKKGVKRVDSRVRNGRAINTRAESGALTKLGAGGDAVLDAKQDGMETRRIVDVVRSLGDEKFEVREEAMFILLQNQKIKPSQLVQAYNLSESLEVRSRLKRVLWHYLVRDEIRARHNAFSRLDRGRLGVKFLDRDLVGSNVDASDEQEVAKGVGMRVYSTIVGMPGYAYLRSGDRILVIDGKKIEGVFSKRVQRFVDLAGGHRPGDVVVLKVLRDKRVVDVRFKYGSYIGHSRVYTRGNNDYLGNRIKAELELQLEGVLKDDGKVRELKVDG